MCVYKHLASITNVNLTYTFITHPLLFFSILENVITNSLPANANILPSKPIMKTLQKSQQIKEGHQKLSFPGLPSLLHSSCLLSIHWRLWHDTDFWRPKLLIKLFLGEMNGSLGRGGPREGDRWMESLNFTSYVTHRRLLRDEKLRIFMPLQNL